MRKRNVQTNIRMTQEEVEQIKKKANKANMTFSNYVIASSLNKEVVVIDGIKDFTHQLSKIGTNLNQLTMLCHQGKISCPDINSTNNILKEIWIALMCIRKQRS